MEGPVSERLESSWRLADDLFDRYLHRDAILDKPITLRNPFIFYRGHLAAFAYNRVSKYVEIESHSPEFDYRFERGIDPDVDDPSKCHSHPEIPDIWPAHELVIEYSQYVEKQLAERVEKISGRDTLEMVIEHTLMHVETLLYMMLQLDEARKVSIEDARLRAREALTCPCPELMGATVVVPAGKAILGRDRGEVVNGTSFGWDNEFGTTVVDCDSFEASVLPVTVGEFVRFINAGGYDKPELWNEEDWAWRQTHDITHPACLRPSNNGIASWTYLTVTAPGLALEEAKDLPIYVSLAEARAFAAWHRKRLPTEAEWHRMALGTADGKERSFPWGEDPGVPGVHGNFGFHYLQPAGVGRFPEGKSHLGLLDLIGNGWELTETAFGPFAGFEPHPDYPEYSADFFEGKHYVVKGASWATGPQLIRKSFRNWYQAHYPYVFSKFRLVA